MQTHSQEKQFPHQVCWSIFSMRSGLRNHMWKHTREKAYFVNGVDLQRTLVYKGIWET